MDSEGPHLSGPNGMKRRREGPRRRKPRPLLFLPSLGAPSRFPHPLPTPFDRSRRAGFDSFRRLGADFSTLPMRTIPYRFGSCGSVLAIGLDSGRQPLGGRDYWFDRSAERVPHSRWNLLISSKVSPPLNLVDLVDLCWESWFRVVVLFVYFISHHPAYNSAAFTVVSALFFVICWGFGC